MVALGGIADMAGAAAQLNSVDNDPSRTFTALMLRGGLPKGSFESIGYGLSVLGAGHEAACHDPWRGD
jgi:hypothetical protein